MDSMCCQCSISDSGWDVTVLLWFFIHSDFWVSLPILNSLLALCPYALLTNFLAFICPLCMTLLPAFLAIDPTYVDPKMPKLVPCPPGSSADEAWYSRHHPLSGLGTYMPYPKEIDCWTPKNETLIMLYYRVWENMWDQKIGMRGVLSISAVISLILNKSNI